MAVGGVNVWQGDQWRVASRLCAVLLLTVWLTGCNTPSAPPNEVAVDIAGRTYRLELALTDEARYQGLSDRLEIAEDGGMLFVFPDDQVQVRSFVMRRCHVPIDIIFLDPARRIVAMHEMAVEPPDTPEHELTHYSSRYPTQFAIELAGGSLDVLGLKPGQKIELPVDELKRYAQ